MLVIEPDVRMSKVESSARDRSTAATLDELCVNYIASNKLD